MESLFLLCLAFPRRAGIHTCAIHSAACQYSTATQFPPNCSGSFDAQSYCSAEINREMFGPSNHGDVYNLLQSNSANRILTRTGSVVNAQNECERVLDSLHAGDKSGCGFRVMQFNVIIC